MVQAEATGVTKHRFHGSLEGLRAAERIRRLEVERVVDLCLGAFKAKTLLDIGTGSGLFAQTFAQRGLKVTAVDVDPSMLDAARQYVPQATFELVRAEALPYEPGSFDLVFLGVVLHETDGQLRVLQEARRVARLGVAVLEWQYRAEKHGPPLAERIRPQDLAVLARQAGFRKFEALPLENVTLYRLSRSFA